MSSLSAPTSARPPARERAGSTEPAGWSVHEEGTRIVSNLAGIEPGDVEIGMPVRVSIENVDEELKLPLFRPVG